MAPLPAVKSATAHLRANHPRRFREGSEKLLAVKSATAHLRAKLPRRFREGSEEVQRRARGRGPAVHETESALGVDSRSIWRNLAQPRPLSGQSLSPHARDGELRAALERRLRQPAP